MLFVHKPWCHLSILFSFPYPWLPIRYSCCPSVVISSGSVSSPFPFSWFYCRYITFSSSSFLWCFCAFNPVSIWDAQLSLHCSVCFLCFAEFPSVLSLLHKLLFVAHTDQVIFLLSAILVILFLSPSVPLFCPNELSPALILVDTLSFIFYCLAQTHWITNLNMF